MSFLSALGRAIGDGMTLAAEILCPRDHTAEDRLRSWESAAEAVEDAICDEAEAADEANQPQWFGAKALCRLYGSPCEPICADCVRPSAAVSAAADPSPTVPNAHSVVGGDGPDPDSVILSTVGSGQPIDLSSGRCRFTDLGADGAEHWCDLERGHSGYHEATNDAGERIYASHRNYDGFAHTPPVVAESDPGAVSTPASGEAKQCQYANAGGCIDIYACTECPPIDRSVSEDDLAAHIMGDFVSGQEVDPLTATLIDAISSHIANSLLTDFHITRK